MDEHQGPTPLSDPLRHTIEQAAVDTAARNLTGERVTFWAPPGVVLDTPQRGSMHSLPLDVPVVVGVDLDLVEWAEACPPTWVELAQISERREAMLFTGGVLKLLDPMGVFVVKLGGGPWRSDFPAAGQWVLGFWRGRHVLCMWTRSPDGSRGWWLNGNMDDQLTASDGPDYWMPLPNAPDRRLPRFRPANP